MSDFRRHGGRSMSLASTWVCLAPGVDRSGVMASACRGGFHVRSLHTQSYLRHRVADRYSLSAIEYVGGTATALAWYSEFSCVDVT